MTFIRLKCRATDMAPDQKDDDAPIGQCSAEPNFSANSGRVTKRIYDLGPKERSDLLISRLLNPQFVQSVSNSLSRRQGFYDPAISHRTATALVDNTVQFRLQGQ